MTAKEELWQVRRAAMRVRRREEEILQALEICKDVKSGVGCSSCPYFKAKSSRCLMELLNDAYNLLKEVE